MPFTPTEASFFGGYLNIAVHDGIIVPIWSRMDNGATSVWTSVIKQDDLIKADDSVKKEESKKKKKK
jgi:hypothetical protein